MVACCRLSSAVEITEIKSMYYRLSDCYALRGYCGGKHPTILDLKTRQKHRVTGEIMSLLRMCDGETDSAVFDLVPLLKRMADTAVRRGWITCEVSGRTLLPEQRYRELPVPGIADFHWSITGKCNARCRHCFISDSQSGYGDLTTEDMLGIIDKLGAYDVPEVCLTGGEPLCRTDLPVLLEAMHDKRIHAARVCSNGFLLTDEVLDLFEKYGHLPCFQISFDGVGCHDWMRGIRGAEAKTVKAMELCRERGVPVVLSMCLHAGNICSIPDTVRLAAEKGVRVLRLGFTEDIGGFSRSNGVVPLTMDELGKVFLDYLPVFCREKPNISLVMSRFVRINGTEPEKYGIIPIEHSCTDFDNNSFCKLVEHSFYLNAQGRVLPCIEFAGTSVENECLKLSEHSLEECLHSPLFDSFFHSDALRLLRENPECKHCGHLLKCGCGCRGNSFAYGLGMYGIDQKRCDFFKHGWVQRIRRVMDECLKIA